MPSVTKAKDETKNMATNVATGGQEEPRDERPAARAERAERVPGRGFFTVYKRGQGYWTRMGTVAAAVLIGLLSADFIYSHLKVWLPDAWSIGTKTKVVVAASLAFLAAYSLFAYWIMNKPTNVDFLIATDSEMKKVNWTTKHELIGSTKVVIVFMFIIAVVLFVIDILFGFFFHWIGVLKSGPFG